MRNIELKYFLLRLPGIRPFGLLDPSKDLTLLGILLKHFYRGSSHCNVSIYTEQHDTKSRGDYRTMSRSGLKPTIIEIYLKTNRV